MRDWEAEQEFLIDLIVGMSRHPGAVGETNVKVSLNNWKSARYDREYVQTKESPKL